MSGRMFDPGRHGFGEKLIGWVANNQKAALFDPTQPATWTREITNVTNANPAVYTSAAHGFSNGDIILNGGIGGNLSANQLGRATAVAANTYQMLTLEGAGIAVAGSGIYVGRLGGRPHASHVRIRYHRRQRARRHRLWTSCGHDRYRRRALRNEFLMARGHASVRGSAGVGRDLLRRGRWHGCHESSYRDQRWQASSRVQHQRRRRRDDRACRAVHRGHSERVDALVSNGQWQRSRLQPIKAIVLSPLQRSAARFPRATKRM